MLRCTPPSVPSPGSQFGSEMPASAVDVPVEQACGVDVPIAGLGAQHIEPGLQPPQMAVERGRDLALPTLIELAAEETPPGGLEIVPGNEHVLIAAALVEGTGQARRQGDRSATGTSGLIEVVVRYQSCGVPPPIPPLNRL